MTNYKDTIKQEFDSIAEDYVNKAYIEGLTLQSVDKFINYLPGKGRVLDIGCGGGQDSQAFINNGYKAVGIDLSPRMLKLAKQFSRKTKFIQGDFLEVGFDDEEFVAVWCMRMFLLVPFAKEKEFMNKINKILKPGGHLFISAKVGSSDTEEIDERGVFRKEIMQDSFEMLLKYASFEILEIKRNGSWMQAICKKK
jgi:ubiquinone/menaquinone biosynthesis C-methylase UbiE